MGLIQCPDCGSMISEHAPALPAGVRPNTLILLFKHLQIIIRIPIRITVQVAGS